MFIIKYFIITTLVFELEGIDFLFQFLFELLLTINLLFIDFINLFS